MVIRKTTLEDLPVLMEIYKRARDFMRETGNASQWGDHYPEKELIEADIAAGNSYVCIHEGDIAATFFYSMGPDETYATIYDGDWKKDGPYAVVHRVAVDKKGVGIVSYCLTWAFEQYPNVRIDTHENNHAMQHALKKNGFSYCGKITLKDGSERIAFQRV